MGNHRTLLPWKKSDPGLTDALGNLVDFVLMPGQAHDLRARDITPVLPPKSNSRFPAEFDTETYKWRHLVENYFGKQRYSHAVMQNRPKFHRLHFNSSNHD